MSNFQKFILRIEKENASVAEVYNILRETLSCFSDRMTSQFMSLSVKSILAKDSVSDAARKRFVDDVDFFYSACTAYLEKWTADFSQFQCLTWMLLYEYDDPQWAVVENCLLFLQSKNVLIDDNYLFTEFGVLKSFIAKRMSDDRDFWISLSSSDKWVAFFKQNEGCKNLLQLAQFYFAIPCHNANVERIFSLMQTQWTDDRNRLNVSSIKSLLTVSYNLKGIKCKDFHAQLLQNNTLLRKIMSSLKYE